jgi:hypothetical protein
MKKLLLLILPVLFLAVACNNKTTGGETATTSDSTNVTPAASSSTAAKTDTTSGTGAMPAQVWEEISGKPVTDATVTAKQGTQVVEEVKSDAKGNYTYTKLTKGTNYTFVVSKNGYSSQTQTAAYDGTNSLPGFALK